MLPQSKSNNAFIYRLIVIAIIPFTGIYNSFHWTRLLLVFVIGVAFGFVFLKLAPRKGADLMALVISSVIGMLFFPFIGLVIGQLFKDPFWIGATVFFLGADLVDIVDATMRQNNTKRP
jgi:predicted membrane channel-forming protein YqfA (hemolysin III family)